jgi:hypothetical protein
MLEGMILRLSVVAALVTSLAVTSCKRDPCDGPSSFDYDSKVIGSFSMDAKSTWAVRTNSETIKIYAADYEQDPSKLGGTPYVTAKEGKLVFLDINGKLARIAAGTTHTWRGDDRSFTADVAWKRPRPERNLGGIVWDAAEGTLTVKAVNDQMICGEMEISDKGGRVKGRFVAPFVPKK